MEKNEIEDPDRITTSAREPGRLAPESMQSLLSAERTFPIKKTLTKSSESAKLLTRKLFIMIQSIHLLSFENFHRILSEGRKV